MKVFVLVLGLMLGLAVAAEAQTSLTSLTNDLSWGAVPVASAYVVERDTDGAGFVEVAVVAAPQLTYQDAALPLGPTYTWHVKARKPSGLTSLPSPTCTTDSSLPAAPASLSCSVTFQ